MICRFILATIACVIGLSGTASAVDKLGAASRIDVDPGGERHQFGVIYVTRTAPGGFAVAWEQDNAAQSSLIYEDIRFRIYGDTFAAVAGPQSANLAGDKRLPNLSRIVPLDTDKAYLVYALTRDNDSPDHPEIREAFGQTIVLATGLRSGKRRLLNTVGISDTLVGIAAGLPDGRAVFAWYETDAFDPTRGRFIRKTGVPQPVGLDFVCCDSGIAQLTSLQPVGDDIIGTYLRNSVFPGSNGIYGRTFRPNGQPRGAAQLLTAVTTSPTPKALSSGRTVAFEYVQIGSDPVRFRLDAQVYRRDWTRIGGAKTLLADLSETKYIDFAPTLDGGLFMIRTTQNGSTFKRTVRRLDSTLARVGPDYTFASPHGFDFFRIAALTDDRAVVVYRNIVDGRQRLFAQIVSY